MLSLVTLTINKKWFQTKILSVCFGWEFCSHFPSGISLFVMLDSQFFTVNFIDKKIICYFLKSKFQIWFFFIEAIFSSWLVRFNNPDFYADQCFKSFGQWPPCWATTPLSNEQWAAGPSRLPNRNELKEKK